jgi:cysteinyl-tRNA synthetase
VFFCLVIGLILHTQGFVEWEEGEGEGEGKKDQRDFSLWKAANDVKPTLVQSQYQPVASTPSHQDSTNTKQIPLQKQEQSEPSWASPWGFGRPGWHIECSAMSWYAFPVI